MALHMPAVDATYYLSTLNPWKRTLSKTFTPKFWIPLFCWEKLILVRNFLGTWVTAVSGPMAPRHRLWVPHLTLRLWGSGSLSVGPASSP